ncbi:hypothetical protein [Promicromonospora sp. NPDC019610]|uniref:hypothetical protein n=1 Tax=Promicromonospora sp. NPDC019610 TaxID=3364405 RepID=UPI0037A78368
MDFIYKTRLYLLARTHGTWSGAARAARLSPESLKNNVKQLGDRLARLQDLPDGTLLAWENGRLTPTPLGTWLEDNGGPVVTAHDAVFGRQAHSRTNSNASPTMVNSDVPSDSSITCPA